MVVVVNLTGRPCFCFIEMFAVGLGIGGVVGLAIDKIVLTRANITVGIFGLSLW